MSVILFLNIKSSIRHGMDRDVCTFVRVCVADGFNLCLSMKERKDTRKRVLFPAPIVSQVNDGGDDDLVNTQVTEGPDFDDVKKKKKNLFVA